MPYVFDYCLIWGSEYSASGSPLYDNNTARFDDSLRAGGGYVIPWPSTLVSNLSDEYKARLTTWLIDQRMQGVELPEITQAVVDHVERKRPLPVHDRADRLLRFIAGLSEKVADRVSVTNNTLAAYAWSESTSWGEVDYYLDYLMEMGWIAGDRVISGNFFGIVTVAGYNRIADLRTNTDFSQAFVAMWFNDSTAKAYEAGIEAGIRDAGFNPVRIDRTDHINKIEDEIIAEIRRSRFVVADFTQGEDGARGGVYYEAGFAHGLDLPVIFTCHEKSLKNLHFDTAHYSHIVWADPSELREKLRNRIRAVIGQGPVVNPNA